MSRRARVVALCAACAALLSVVSCASQKMVPIDNLTAGEIFQHAQDAMDRGDYTLGISYYKACQQKFPDDMNHVTWASYEIAFAYHKMGDNARAIALFKELLDQYAKGGDALPPGPQVLAQKLVAHLEEASKKS